MKKNIKIILIIIVVIILGVLIGFKFNNKEKNGKLNSLELIKEKGELVLGLDDSFPPMGFRNEDNEIVGFDIDVAKAVCEKMGVELKIQPISWDAKEQELNTYNIDCIWNGMSKTIEREEALTLSDAYMKNSMVLVTKNETSFNDVEDLNGKVIGVQSGSSAEELLEGSEFYNKLKNVISYSDNMTAFMDLETNQIDAVFVDEVLANYYIASNNKDYKVIDANLDEEEYVIGFRKQDIELSNEINLILKELKKDGTLKTISEKWFGKDVTIIE